MPNVLLLLSKSCLCGVVDLTETRHDRRRCATLLIRTGVNYRVKGQSLPIRTGVNQRAMGHTLLIRTEVNQRVMGQTFYKVWFLRNGSSRITMQGAGALVAARLPCVRMHANSANNEQRSLQSREKCWGQLRPCICMRFMAPLLLTQLPDHLEA